MKGSARAGSQHYRRTGWVHGPARAYFTIRLYFTISNHPDYNVSDRDLRRGGGERPRGHCR